MELNCDSEWLRKMAAKEEERGGECSAGGSKAMIPTREQIADVVPKPSDVRCDPNDPCCYDNTCRVHKMLARWRETASQRNALLAEHRAYTRVREIVESEMPMFDELAGVEQEHERLHAAAEEVLEKNVNDLGNNQAAQTQMDTLASSHDKGGE